MLAPLLAVVAATTLLQGPRATPVREPRAPARRVTRAVRAVQPPKLDGKDDDAVWATAQRIDDFTQFDPKPNGAATHRTEFRVAYDDKNLYAFVRMYDPHPDSILHALSRRDQRGPSDQIKLVIDSYHDRRSGFEFCVNPDGVKRDFSMSDDGNEDASWDGIWDVATAVDSLGWTAEFRIPLSQLRYPAADQHVFGFGVWRDIERYKERDAWPDYDPRKSGLSSQLGDLVGLTGLTSARRVEAAPYTVTKNVEKLSDAGIYSRAQQTTIGGDLKLGVTPNVTIDATVNPDFGQVEADPAVVNLTAFETFFAERRPFFVEGTSLYQFALNCYIVVDCSTNEGLFYSRRIGRTPSLLGTYGDNGTAQATPITAAAKVTGRTEQGLSFGVLDAVTPRVPGVAGQTVEPGANYAVVRAQQDWDAGRTGLGIIATGVDRTLDPSTAPYLHRNAYALGANFRQRFANNNYELDAQVAGSQVNGSAAAILATQENSVHYYQQPGAGAGVDSTRTSLGGYEAQLKFGKYGGGITRFESSIVRLSEGFDVNDLGYLRRADITDWSTWASLVFKDPTSWYRWAQLNANHWLKYNGAGDKIDHGVNVNGHVGLTGVLENWDAHLGGTVANVTSTVCDRCTRGGPVLRESAGFFPWGGINTDSRQTVSGGIWFNYGITDGGRSYSTSYSPYLNIKAGTRFTTSFSFGYSTNVNDSQWFGNFTDSATNVTHYAFGHLDQTTVSASARVNYTATPNLTFEFYAAPFVSNGTYTNLRQVSATPEAANYLDRFAPYTIPAGNDVQFKYAQLRTNSVVRWEYSPGSTLFVVWQHGREDSESLASTRTWVSDFNGLLDLHPENTFLVKLAYWITR